MADHTVTEATEPDAHDTEEHPRGTLVLLLGFLVLTAVLWGWVYLLLLSRS